MRKATPEAQLRARLIALLPRPSLLSIVLVLAQSRQTIASERKPLEQAMKWLEGHAKLLRSALTGCIPFSLACNRRFTLDFYLLPLESLAQNRVHILLP
jgi:hypothetical protein